MEIHVVLLRLLRLRPSSVFIKASRKLFELHDIASQRARFVGEDIFDLPQLLIEVTGLSSHLHALLGIEHAEVVAHEDSLEELDQLERDHE